MSHNEVISADGLALAVYPHGDPGAPTVVAVHGYPDDHTVFDGVVQELRGRHHVVTYDVRGAGASGAPAGREGYDLERLAEDLRAVVDAVSPDTPVHLLAHDWGAIQTWHAVTGPGLTGRVASFTSMSGPCLDHVGLFLAGRGGATRREILRQGLDSWYTALFRVPVLPELLWRSGLAGALVAATDGVPRPKLRDAVNGLELYRRNLPARLGHPQPRRTDVAVQVLAPRGDRYVTPALQTKISAYAPDLRVRRLPGGHWMLRTRPDVVARCVAEHVAHAEGAPEAPALARARAAARPGAGRSDIGRRDKGHRDNGRWDGALVVVTGAGSGIGRATAAAFARRGARVVVADIDGDAAKRTAETIGTAAPSHGAGTRSDGAGRAFPMTVDVADEAAVSRLAAEVAAEHGVPDVVVNNAGIGMAGSFAETTVADWQRIVDVNLWGVIHGCRAFSALLAAHGEGGHIVNVASAAAYLPSRTLAAYATTKSAVLTLSACLRAELADDGIGVTALCPGFVHTDITRTTRFVGLDPEAEQRRQKATTALYARRNYTPERVAEHVVRAVERNAPLAPVTAEAHTGLLASRLSPALLRAIARRDIGPR